MPALTFLNPFFLWGLGLGSIPIIIHLLQRRRFRVRQWAAMEFLQLSVRNTAPFSDRRPPARSHFVPTSKFSES